MAELLCIALPEITAEKDLHLNPINLVYLRMIGLLVGPLAFSTTLFSGGSDPLGWTWAAEPFQGATFLSKLLRKTEVGSYIRLLKPLWARGKNEVGWSRVGLGLGL